MKQNDISNYVTEVVFISCRICVIVQGYLSSFWNCSVKNSTLIISLAMLMLEVTNIWLRNFFFDCSLLKNDHHHDNLTRKFYIYYILKFEYLKNKKNFWSEIKTFFLVSKYYFVNLKPKLAKMYWTQPLTTARSLARKCVKWFLFWRKVWEQRFSLC